MRLDEELAHDLNRNLGTLNDQTISDNPFKWDIGNADKRRETLSYVQEKLSGFVYVPRTDKVKKIVAVGVVLPLVPLLVLLFANLQVPVDYETLFYIEGALALWVIAGLIYAWRVADDPNIDLDLFLALYAIPKGWSFSRANSSEAWETYKERFGYFNRGDEGQGIRVRVWGWLDNAKQKAFQILQFHYDTVYYTTTTVNGVTTRTKHVVPHNRFGIFIQMPESKKRFRITETGENPGFAAEMDTNYAELEKAVNIFHDPGDEQEIRKFLSPAVLRVLMEMSDAIGAMVLDFYPGFVMIMTEDDFTDHLYEIELNRNTSGFAEAASSFIADIENFRSRIADGIAGIAKYND